MKYRVQEELQRDAELRSLVSLSGKFASTWAMDLRRLTPTAIFLEIQRDFVLLFKRNLGWWRTEIQGEKSMKTIESVVL